jgi:hypothetical protein
MVKNITRNDETAFLLERRYCVDRGMVGYSSYIESLNMSVYDETSVNTRKILTVAPGVPRYIHGNFECDNLGLDSLLGGPDTVDGDYVCHHNNLTSLDGIATSITGDLLAQHNLIESTSGIPQNVRSIGLGCNRLTSSGDLSYLCDDRIHSIYLYGNPLVDIGPLPEHVDTLDISNTLVTDLHDIHRKLQRCFRFDASRSSIRSSILGLMYIEIHGVITLGWNDHRHDADAVQTILNKWKNQGRKGVLGAQRELLDLGYDELARI